MIQLIRQSVKLPGLFVLCFLLSACQSTPGATPPPGGGVTGGTPTLDSNSFGSTRAGSAITTEDVDRARTHDRMLSVEQLPANTQRVLGVTGGVISPAAAGTGGHPFTTARASAEGKSTPVEEDPWRSTGKLIMKFGTSTFVCTASVIGKNLLVTAAHCVHEFGDKQAGFADAVTFEPARHEGSRPFGTWIARQWWVPTSYFDGTDVCSQNAPGIVCENDVAVVVLEPNQGRFIAEVTGTYGFPSNDNFGYVDFLGEKAAQITQLGYPSESYDGDKMIRTDSLGYRDVPNNLVIGSNQTGGSSGGPWLQNFGTRMTEFTGAPAFGADPNQVVATTSWGFNDGAVKIQGASRFSRNTAYTQKSNIQSLVDSVCGANPDAC